MQSWPVMRAVFFEGQKGAAHVNHASAVIFFFIGLIVLFLAAEPFF